MIVHVRSWSCGGAFQAEHSELLTHEKWGWNVVFVVVVFWGGFSFPFVCVCVRGSSSEYCSVWHSRVNSLTGDETTPLLVVILLLIMSSLSVARAREARQCYLLKANRTLASWVFAFFFCQSLCDKLLCAFNSFFYLRDLFFVGFCVCVCVFFPAPQQ